jgi:hypothetical protein
MVCCPCLFTQTVIDLFTERVDSKRVRSAAYLEDALPSSDNSPLPSPSAQLTRESKGSGSHQRSPSRIPTITTPLLMPPPATPMSTLKHRISLCQHYLVSWASHNRQMLLLAIRLAIFLLKMLSITRPCLPAATREVLLYPLVSLAALELALGTRTSWSFVSVFAAAHVLVLGWAVRLGGGLCERRGLSGEWEWE